MVMILPATVIISFLHLLPDHLPTGVHQPADLKSWRVGVGAGVRISLYSFSNATVPKHTYVHPSHPPRLAWGHPALGQRSSG